MDINNQNEEYLNLFTKEVFNSNSDLEDYIINLSKKIHDFKSAKIGLDGTDFIDDKLTVIVKTKSGGFYKKVKIMEFIPITEDLLKQYGYSLTSNKFTSNESDQFLFLASLRMIKTGGSFKYIKNNNGNYEPVILNNVDLIIPIDDGYIGYFHELNDYYFTNTGKRLNFIA